SPWNGYLTSATTRALLPTARTAAIAHWPITPPPITSTVLRSGGGLLSNGWTAHAIGSAITAPSPATPPGIDTTWDRWATNEALQLLPVSRQAPFTVPGL